MLERLVARLALLDGQCFRIVELIAQPPWEVAGVEDYRSRENRTRERGAPPPLPPTHQPLSAALRLATRAPASGPPPASSTPQPSPLQPRSILKSGIVPPRRLLPQRSRSSNKAPRRCGTRQKEH